jgi:hypothetical protein
MQHTIHLNAVTTATITASDANEHQSTEQSPREPPLPVVTAVPLSSTEAAAWAKGVGVSGNTVEHQLDPCRTLDLETGLDIVSLFVVLSLC